MANSKGINYSVAVALGAGVGAAIGAATHNMGPAVAAGVAVGVVLGTFWRSGGARTREDGCIPPAQPDSDKQ